MLVVEDAGDTLHAQRNALDSGYVVDVTSASCWTQQHGDNVTWELHRS